jgi:hypothetical protein
MASPCLAAPSPAVFPFGSGDNFLLKLYAVCARIW